MADFFFFTDLDLLISQSSDDAFGSVLSTDPIYDATKEKYRLTSIHKATVNPLAYAICKGQILVQEDSVNASLVNIILKPEVQPKNDLPFVKYYIYRGILKNSLTDGTNVINGGNTLTKKIRDTNLTTPKKVLGIELIGASYSNTDPIDNAFYLPKAGFELWTVYGGWSIGAFDKTSFGVEIILEKVGFNPDLSIARTNLNVCEVLKLTGTPSQADEFEYKTKKEIVSNYIDPCAFFGNFYYDTIYARNSSDIIDANNIPKFSVRTGDSMYRDIIDGGTTSLPKQHFYNRNSIYIDIRNDLNFSYNYFENYNNGIKISFIDDSNEPSNLLDYYNSGWPILKIDNFPLGNNYTSLRISPFIGDNISPVIFVVSGDRKIPIIERITKGKSRFMDLKVDLNISNFSLDSLFIKCPNYNNNEVISRYVKIKYLNKTEQSISTNTSALNIMKREDPWDVVFDIQQFITQSQLTTNNPNLHIYNEDVYVDDLIDNNVDFIGNVGYIEDSNDIFFLCYATLLKTKSLAKRSPRNFSLQNSDINSNIYDYIKSRNENLTLMAQDLNLPGGLTQILKFGIRKNSNSIKDVDLNKTFFTLSITKTDWNNIINLVSNIYSPFSPVVFVIKNRNDKDANSNNDVDSEGVEFISADIYLRGLVISSGSISQMETATNIKIYSFTNN